MENYLDFSVFWRWTAMIMLAGGLFSAAILSSLTRGNVRKGLGLVGVIFGLVLIPFIWVQGIAVIWSIFLTSVALTTIVNAGRMHAARFNDRDKAFNALIDTLALAVLFLCGAGLSQIVSGMFFNLAVVMLALILGIDGVYRIIFAYRHYRFPSGPASDELPSLTLAIPARNETRELADCLMAACASDYKKLEIIVLDDCSQDRTSHVIRSFAQDGVQFVQGDKPADGWLGKNYAMSQLTKHANGEYIAYMGVDTRLSQESLSRLMSVMILQKLDMISVLPRRDYAWQFSGIMETIRYFWQMVLPPTSWRTPVSSSIWLIRREALDRLGSFAHQKYKVLPENHFARALIKDKKYSFFTSNQTLGIFDAKKWSSQVETAIRTLYPKFHRHPVEILGSIWLHLVLLAPYVMLILAPVNQSLGVLFYVSLAAVVVIGSTGMLSARLVRSSWPLTFITFPLQITQNIILHIMSVIAYEFGEVNWKSRNICYPVMVPSRTNDKTDKSIKL